MKTAPDIASPHPPRRFGGPQFALLASGVTIVLAALPVREPGVLINTTASEPAGFYRRIGVPPDLGRLVAFKAPQAAFPYADAHLGYLRRVPMLKTVAAVPGDQVCVDGGVLVIAGRYRAPIADVDQQGRALPHWRGCRRMGADELFVFSDRVPNSFDSRYFGPVSRQAVLGVYAPLVIISEGGR